MRPGDHFRFPWQPQLGQVLRAVLEPEATPEVSHEDPLPTAACGLSDQRLDRHARAQRGSGCACSALGRPAHTLVSSYGKTRGQTQLVPAPCAAQATCCALETRQSGECRAASASTEEEHGAVCPCLPGPGQPRLFTPRECARLQGFPERFQTLQYKQWYRCVGNAVPPPVVATVAGSLICSLFHDGHCTHPGLPAALRLTVDSAAPGRVAEDLLRAPLIWRAGAGAGGEGEDTDAECGLTVGDVLRARYTL